MGNISAYKYMQNYDNVKVKAIYDIPNNFNGKDYLNISWLNITYIRDIDWCNVQLINCTDDYIYNIKWLQLTPILRHLYISCNNISSLDGLQKCTALRELHCRNNKLNSLDCLQNCTALKYLHCNNNKLTSLDGLQNCTDLQELRCNNNKLTSLDGLQNCTALRELYCNNNKLTSLDGLQNCTYLQMLYISNNKLVSLNGLQNCTALQMLDISDNKISTIDSLDGLQNCTALQILYISNNKLVSLNGLQNCTDIRTLYILGNTGLVTLPNFLIEFRNLEYFYYNDLELELDARQRRWLNRFQNIQYNTNSMQVYGNSQNVHDSSIQETVRASITRLLNQPLMPSYNVDTITYQIVIDTVLTPKSKDQLISYISTTSTSSQEELVELSLTYGELLWAVWQTIHSLGKFDEETQNQIKQILNQELEDSDCKCFTGRMTRLVNCINGFSPLVEVKILDGVQIGNIVAIIKQRLIDSEVDGHKNGHGHGYTVEKHREMFKLEMLDRGESLELIDEWIEYIE